MSAKLIGHVRGFTLFETVSHEVTVWRGSDYVGSAFPRVVAEPEGSWFARKTGLCAVPFGCRHLALAHLLGGCPDCACNPVLCEADDSGDSCLDCAACMHGCPEDLCDMTRNGDVT